MDGFGTERSRAGSHAYLTEKNRLLTDRVDELEGTLEQKDKRIDTLEAEIERLTAELADRDREREQTREEQAVTVSEGDDESEIASVWGRTKRLFESTQEER